VLATLQSETNALKKASVTIIAIFIFLWQWRMALAPVQKAVVQVFHTRYAVFKKCLPRPCNRVPLKTLSWYNDGSR
jgi:hypothetical protein